jgi:UDP-N-acetyl-2-amino-2-deoxyglucuronate dehydrogenase
MKNFGLIGAAGYIAPKHLRAIKETGNNLVAALDKTDSVGVLDNYFPSASFFTEFERFDRHIEKLKRAGNLVDFFSICSPNYLHDAHIRFALRHGANVICEKPVVLNPWNAELLQQLEKETGKTVYSILQLRLHPDIIALKEKIVAADPSKIFDVDLTYISARGNWYYSSWKGDDSKSGGIATNIGIHFFDMLGWIFGSVKENIVHLREHDRVAGLLVFQRARVRWFLSINEETLPEDSRSKEEKVYRNISVEGKEINFNEGFSDLHTKSYEAVLTGKGFTLSDALPSIEVAHDIRTSNVVGLKGDYHPFASKKLSMHPFSR